MKTYTKPTLIQFGNAKELIQGNCNWGNENFAMDKTGYWEYTWYYCSDTVNGICSTANLCVPLGGGKNDECSTHSDCKR